jgi:hypothetical protein
MKETFIAHYGSDVMCRVMSEVQEFLSAFSSETEPSILLDGQPSNGRNLDDISRSDVMSIVHVISEMFEHKLDLGMHSKVWLITVGLRLSSRTIADETSTLATSVSLANLLSHFKSFDLQSLAFISSEITRAVRFSSKYVNRTPLVLVQMAVGLKSGGLGVDTAEKYFRDASIPSRLLQDHDALYSIATYGNRYFGEMALYHPVKDLLDEHISTDSEFGRFWAYVSKFA